MGLIDWLWGIFFEPNNKDIITIHSKKGDYSSKTEETKK